jgi:hypothetical protein
MGKTQYPNACGAWPYAGLSLSVCALIILSGWSGCSRRDKEAKHKPAAHPSPITVADGSMLVETYWPYITSPAKPNEVAISGGHACSLTANTTLFHAEGQDWIITSSDNQATVSTNHTGGAAIVATGPNVQDHPNTGKGPGKEFTAQFSPATVTIAGQSFKCASRCTVVIDYKAKEEKCSKQ